MNQQDNVDRMNEFKELRHYSRQLRKNAHELDDMVQEMQWIAAGGRGVYEPDQFHRLVDACLQMCEYLDDRDILDPYEVREE